MAKTRKDIELNARIRNLSEQLNELGKTKEEAIEIIAGRCGITLRTASEHYRAFLAQKTLLLEHGFKEKCNHRWTNWTPTPSGLVKQCLICGVTENAS